MIIGHQKQICTHVDGKKEKKKKKGSFPNEICRFLFLKYKIAEKEMKELQHGWSNSHCERKNVIT